MAAKSWREVAIECMRRPGFPTPYFPDSYALNEAKPLGRQVNGNGSSQYDRAVLVMGRYLDSRAFSPSTNPDFQELAYLDSATLSDLASRSWNELLMWCQVYVAEPYTAAILQTMNQRLVLWDWRMLIQSVSTGQWIQSAYSDAYFGHLISPDFRFEYPATPAVNERIEASGYKSVRPVYDAAAPYAGQGFPYWAFHGYTGGNQFVTASDVAQIVVSCKMSRIVDNPALPFDAAERPFAFGLGVDAYPTPRIYLYPSVGCSRHRQVAAVWPDYQFCVMTTQTEAQINAPGGVPPIFASAAETYDEGGGGGTVTPPGPAPSKGRWVDIYNPTSPKARWADIAASVAVAPQWGAPVPLTATIGVAFSFTPTLTAGTPTITFSKVSGPTWANVSSSTGQITGTPTGSPVETTIVVRANNGTGGNVDLTLPLSVVAAPPAVSVVTTSLPNAVQSQAYSETLTATGVAPFVWAVTAGTLPAGTTLQGAVISGTPTTIATASFTVQVTDALGRTATRALSITVGAASSLPVITTPTLPAGTVGVAYSQTIAATGTGTITRAVVSGTLPPGLSLAPTGVLSGTPTSAGGYGFTVRATNSFGYVEVTYYLIIAAAGTAPVASPWGQFVRQ